MILEQLWQDLRYSLRLMRKSRLLTISVVLTLALGIGANSLVFSVVRAVILRPLDYSNADQLVQLWESGKGVETGSDWVSFPNFRDWSRQAQSFTGIAAYTYSLMTLSGDKEAEPMLGLETSDRLFDVLGVKPVLGRTFVEGEDQPGHDPVAVISYGLWQRRYAGATEVVGRSVDIGGRPHTIIGVMPPTFRFPNGIASGTRLVPIDLWVVGSTRSDLEQRGSHNFWTVARLKPNLSLAQARSEMDAIGTRLAGEFPQSNKGTGVSVAYLRDHFTRDSRPALLMLLGSVGLLLLLACANIANLLLSRAESRRREMAVREAIGAGRGRLIRQTLTESVILAFFGAAAGLAVIYGSLEFLLKWAPADIPRIQQSTIDLPVLLFTSVVALAAGILFGLAPAIIGTRCDLQDALKRSGTRSSSGRTNFALRHVLTAGQVALAVMLLIAAGLLVRSLLNVTHLDPGFRAERVFMAFLSLNSQPRYAEPAQQAAFFDEVLRRVRAVPGVESAAISDSVPLSGVNDLGGFAIEGRSASELQQYGLQGPQANRPRVSAGYFQTMGIQVVQGRVFDDHDRADSAKVAVISELAARTYWPGENPIGKHLSVRTRQPVWHEIVGIVRSTRHFGLEAEQKPEIYVPYTQSPEPFMTLVVRAQGDLDSAVRACRTEIASIDPQQAGFVAQPVEDVLIGSQARRRFQTFLLTAFAFLAVFLAAIGIYGVAAYTVTQRAREVGIRLALGARPADVVRLVVRQGTSMIVSGAVAGVLAAIAFSKVIAGLLFGIASFDASTFSSVLMLVLLVGFVSVYLPARRASRVDPAIALSEE